MSRQIWYLGGLLRWQSRSSAICNAWLKLTYIWPTICADLLTVDLPGVCDSLRICVDLMTVDLPGVCDSLRICVDLMTVDLPGVWGCLRLGLFSGVKLTEVWGLVRFGLFGGVSLTVWLGLKLNLMSFGNRNFYCQISVLTSHFHPLDSNLLKNVKGALVHAGCRW